MMPTFQLGGLGRRRGGGTLSLEAQVRAMLVAAGGGAMYRFGPDVGWTDTGLTTPAALGNGLAAVSDISGYGNHQFQATGPARPLLAQVGGYYCSTFDGADDLMQSANTFDIKAGGYLAVASAFPAGASASALGVFELDVGTTNYFRLGQTQSLQRSFAGSRGGSAAPTAVANTQISSVPNDNIPVDTPFINSCYLSTTGITLTDSDLLSYTSNAAPFGANVVPAATNTGVKLGFSRAGSAYLYPETIFGAVYCQDYTKIDETIVRAWLRSISGAP